jgi:hypothetical protein
MRRVGSCSEAWLFGLVQMTQVELFEYGVCLERSNVRKGLFGTATPQ